MAKKRKSARYEATKTSKGRITQIYKSKSDGTAWAKQYRSNSTALKSAKALSSEHKVVSRRVAKGFKFGSIIKRMNRK